MDSELAVPDHEHAAKHDGSGRNYILHQTFANQPKWAHRWGSQPLAAHDHDAYSPLDLVHDHGRGPHHHHISVVDDSAGLLYWLPSAHPPGDAFSRGVSPTVWEEWVRDVMENLPPVIPDNYT